MHKQTRKRPLEDFGTIDNAGTKNSCASFVQERPFLVCDHCVDFQEASPQTLFVTLCWRWTTTGQTHPPPSLVCLLNILPGRHLRKCPAEPPPSQLLPFIHLFGHFAQIVLGSKAESANYPSAKFGARGVNVAGQHSYCSTRMPVHVVVQTKAKS